MIDQWWQQDGGVHTTLLSTVETIAKQQQAFRVDRLAELRAKYGEAPRGIGSVFLGLDIGDESLMPLPLNIIKEVTDAWVATVVRARPRPVEVSIGGDYVQREKAKDRTRFHDGVAYATKLRRHTRKLGREWAVVGAGALKGYHQHGAHKHWAVPIEEIWVDEMDAEDGEPSCMYHTHHVDRHVLAELYPSKKQLIFDAANDVKPGEWYGYNSLSDQVLVTEGWHLPSGPDADDGRHVIAVNNCPLLDKAWTWNRFPFAFLKDDPMSGFWPQSLVHHLDGIQQAISDELEQMFANARQFGKARILVPRSSRVSMSAFTDSLDVERIDYTGPSAPTPFPAVPVPPDTYRRIELLRESAYRLAGLPETMASGQVQPGLESLPAIRAASDVKTARHALDGEIFEEFRLDVADLDLCVAGELAKEGEVETIFVGRRYGREEAKTIKYWVPSRGEQYALRCYPSSQLSEHLSARIQQVAELEQAGAIGPEEKLDLLDVPDVDSAVDSRTAGLRRIEQQIHLILAETQYTPPQPYLPLQLALVRAQAAYNLAQLDDVEEAKLRLLRKWINRVQELMSDGAPTPPPAGMPPEGGMPPAGMPPDGMPPQMPPEGEVMQ